MAKAVLDELASRRPEATVHGRHRRRRHPPEPRRRPVVPGRSHRTGPRCSSRSGSDGTVGANKASVKIIGDRARPVRAGLLRLRLEEVGVDDRVAPAVRARSDPLDVPDRGGRPRRLSPVRTARPLRRARSTPTPVARSCSTRPTRPTRCGTTSPSAIQRPDRRAGPAGLRDRRHPDRTRAEDARPHQHGHAAVLLRPDRGAGSGPCDRRDQEVDHR